MADAKFNHFLVIFGSSGNLACDRIYPSLYNLYLANQLDKFNLKILLVSQQIFSLEVLLKKQKQNYPNPQSVKDLRCFFSKCTFLNVLYNDPNSFNVISKYINNYSTSLIERKINFYLALPDSLYLKVLDGLKLFFDFNSSQKIAIAIEKPFGTSQSTFFKLQDGLVKIIDEKQIFRIDHFLSKYSVKNLLTLKFFNRVFEPLLSNEHIKCIILSQKESVGALGRRAFDRMGIINDIMQNHLLAILACLLMDQPSEFSPKAIDVEKIKALKHIKLKSPDDILIGQYRSYQNEFEGSKTPTFASFVLTSDAERFKDIPIIISAAKKLSNKKCEVRIQFKDPVFSSQPRSNIKSILPNELVIRIQPNDSIYLKTNVIWGGYSSEPPIEQYELDLTFKKRFKYLNNDSSDKPNDISIKDIENNHIPSAYELCMHSFLEFDRHSVVSCDEVNECWRIIDPVNEIAGHKELIIYDDGINNLEELYNLREKYGYTFHDDAYSFPDDY